METEQQRWVMPVMIFRHHQRRVDHREANRPRNVLNRTRKIAASVPRPPTRSTTQRPRFSS